MSRLREGLLALVLALPLLALLCLAVWRLPYPLSEGVSLFEDVAQRPAAAFLNPSATAYYRPLYHLTLSALWHHSGSLDGALAAIKLLLHIVPLCALVLLLLALVRPQNALEVGAATAAIAVLLGSPGLADNLELPLSYTIVGMPAALAVWMLLERSYRPWHGAAVIALFLLAVGFKEQGLVIAPVVVVAWWMGAPGIRRSTVIVTMALSLSYVLFRLMTRDPSLPRFEQDIGFGFGVMSPVDAETRFGSSPLGIYAYNALSTIANILFSEPTGGVFRIVHALRSTRLLPWQMLHVSSSVVMTCVIAAWGIVALKQSGREWSAETRAFAAVVVSVLACGALSFAYSRDRLGGMAVPFYALAAYYAMRTAGSRSARAVAPVALAGAVTLIALATAWQLRTINTIEQTRVRAVKTQREWLTDLGRRRVVFAGRPVYLQIMEQMVAQGTAPLHEDGARLPSWLLRAIGDY